MTTYNTGNPVGSTDPRDRYDNSENFDGAVNGTSDTWTDRLGNVRKSWAGFESETSAALDSYQEQVNDIVIAGGQIFPDEATGRAAVNDGAYYYAEATEPSAALDIYQRVDANESRLVASSLDGRALSFDVYKKTYDSSSVSFRLPPIPLGGRDLQITEFTFDLKPVTGFWVDTKLPWLPSGEYETHFKVFETDQLYVHEWTFDLKPLRGVFKASGELYPMANSEQPELEIVVESVNLINLYTKQTEAGDYIRWQLSRDIVPSRNADVWRIGASNHMIRQSQGVYSDITEVTFNGETDIALGISGKPESIGGRIHGNEELVNYKILFNGVEVDLNNIVGAVLSDVKTVEVLQKTQLFEVGDTDETRWEPKGPVIMEHHKRLIYSVDGWEQLSHIEHIIDGFNVTKARFSMLCLGWGTRGYDTINYGSRSPLWQTEDMSSDPFSEIESQSSIVKAWGDDFSAEIEFIDGWDDPNRYVYFQSNPATRKLYPIWFNEVTSTSKPWTIRSRFKIAYNPTGE